MVRVAASPIFGAGIDLGDAARYRLVATEQRSDDGDTVVMFLVFVLDRLLENPRLELMALSVATDGALCGLRGVFQAQLESRRALDDHSEPAAGPLGRLAFDATKLYPKAITEWNKTTHQATFVNDVPYGTCLSTGVDEAALQGQCNALLSGMKRLKVDGHMEPSDANFDAISQFLEIELPRLREDSEGAAAAVSKIETTFTKRQLKRGIAVTDAVFFNKKQREDLAKATGKESACKYIEKEAVVLREDIVQMQRLVAAQRVTIAAEPDDARRADIAAQFSVDRLNRKRFLADRSLRTLTRIFDFKRSIVCNLMRGGYRMTNNSVSFPIGNWWYGKSPPTRAQMRKLCGAGLMTIAVRVSKFSNLLAFSKN
jgi:hypothetical protein